MYIIFNDFQYFMKLNLRIFNLFDQSFISFRIEQKTLKKIISMKKKKNIFLWDST